MSLSRREFAKVSAGTMLAMLVPYQVAAEAAKALSPDGPRETQDPSRAEYERSGHDWAFVVDYQRCIGCGKCAVACKLENNVPIEPHFNRTWVERYVITDHEEVLVDSPDAGFHGFHDDLAEKYPGVKVRESYYIPKLCNQCDNPPCVQVCPVSATYKLKDGVILVDRKRCIGCRYCIQACPYGARFLDPRLRTADKCTWCYHRITKDLLPACVEACPVGARIFGDRGDPESRVSRILREQKVYVLKPDLKTRPRVFYVNLPEEVR